MSRDLRPIDQYLYDKVLKAQKNTSLRDIVIIKTENNKKINEPLQDPDAKRHYPELSFLFPGFKSMYNAYKSDKTARSIFNIFEKSIVQCENKISVNIKHYPASKGLYNKPNDAFYKTPIPIVVSEWFYGNLDSAFYYADENHYQFEEYIRYHIESAILKNLHKKERNK